WFPELVGTPSMEPTGVISVTDTEQKGSRANESAEVGIDNGARVGDRSRPWLHRSVSRECGCGPHPVLHLCGDLPRTAGARPYGRENRQRSLTRVEVKLAMASTLWTLVNSVGAGRAMDLGRRSVLRLEFLTAPHWP